MLDRLKLQCNLVPASLRPLVLCVKLSFTVLPLPVIIAAKTLVSVISYFRDKLKYVIATAQQGNKGFTIRCQAFQDH